VAASALASNSFLRSAFAAGFPLYVAHALARVLADLQIRETDVRALGACWGDMPTIRAVVPGHAATFCVLQDWGSDQGEKSICSVTEPRNVHRCIRDFCIVLGSAILNLTRTLSAPNGSHRLPMYAESRIRLSNEQTSGILIVLQRSLAFGG
jgi:hypothetical protein